jgi:hypothetical protein
MSNDPNATYLANDILIADDESANAGNKTVKPRYMAVFP